MILIQDLFPINFEDVSQSLSRILAHVAQHIFGNHSTLLLGILILFIAAFLRKSEIQNLKTFFIGGILATPAISSHPYYPIEWFWLSLDRKIVLYIDNALGYSCSHLLSTFRYRPLHKLACLCLWIFFSISCFCAFAVHTIISTADCTFFLNVLCREFLCNPSTWTLVITILIFFHS